MAYRLSLLYLFMHPDTTCLWFVPSWLNYILSDHGVTFSANSSPSSGYHMDLKIPKHCQFKKLILMKMHKQNTWLVVLAIWFISLASENQCFLVQSLRGPMLTSWKKGVGVDCYTICTYRNQISTSDWSYWYFPILGHSMMQCFERMPIFGPCFETWQMKCYLPGWTCGSF